MTNTSIESDSRTVLIAEKMREKGVRDGLCVLGEKIGE